MTVNITSSSQMCDIKSIAFLTVHARTENVRLHLSTARASSINKTKELSNLLILVAVDLEKAECIK